MTKRTFTAALLQGKCPQCREGNIFTYPVLPKIGKFNEMNYECPHCGVRLEPEPGFYQGAMYVGYGFTVAALIAIGVLLYFFWNPSEWTYISIVIGFMVLVAPLNYRYSRIIYLHLFGGIHYEPDIDLRK